MLIVFAATLKKNKIKIMNKISRNQFAELHNDIAGFNSILLVDSLRQVNELIALVTIPWWIASSGSSSDLALLGIVIAIVTFIIVPLVAPIGDKSCKKMQITRSLVVQILIGAGFVALTMQHKFNLTFIIALTCVGVAARSFIDPACAMILPELVTPKRLPAAIQIRKTWLSMSGIVGPFIAGVAISRWGIEGAMCVSLCLYICALFFAQKIPKMNNINYRKNGFRQWWHGLHTGIASKWLVPMERGWTIVNFVIWIFQGPAVGMLIPLKVHALGLAGDWVGISIGALSTGVLVGSLIGSQRLVDLFGRYFVRVGFGVFEALALTVAGLSDSPYDMAMALVVAGFCNTSLALVGATHRSLAIPQAFRVRMLAATTMTMQIAGALGPAIVALLLVHWSVKVVYASFGVLMGVSVLGFLFVPRLKEFLSHNHDEIVDWYSRQYPEVFKSEPF